MPAKRKKTTKKAVRKAPTAAKPPAAPPGPDSVTELMRPLTGLRDQIEEMFDRYIHLGNDLWPRLGSLWDVDPGVGVTGLMRAPKVDLVETDKGYELTAELPGMDEKDLDVDVTGDILTIKGEKREEREEKRKDYHLQERRYGQFRRALRLPRDANANKISARFDQGVLRVEIPRAGGGKKRGRKITVAKA